MLGAGDIVWALVWFFMGLIVFQTRGKSKEVLALIGGALTGYSIISMIVTQQTLFVILNSVVLSKITGTFTEAFYLLGANISRYEQFGRFSARRVVIYLVIIGLWLSVGYAI